ncbi:rCG32144 [Rattus norvegicus]|uniref:RCG32144 n=1 Tax=Rattus norvegicus TaxID=10116 RepID=A6JX38_RAT|nr:rCG32144 [Rattus norvegicus]
MVGTWGSVWDPVMFAQPQESAD